MSKQFTRREIIELCVKRYAANNPNDFGAVKEMNRKRRDVMPDGSRGEFVKNNGKLDMEGDFRVALSMPQNLLEAINNVLKHQNQKSLFHLDDDKDSDREFKWFKENFRLFVVPDLTHKRTF